MFAAIILYAALLVVVYLIVLNGLLRGSKKPQIDAILSVLLCVLIAVSWYLYGWQIGIGTIVGCFVAGILLSPLARRSAQRM